MKIVILGNGIAGTTAARHIRKISDHEILLVSDEHDTFFSRTALMYVYMGHLRLEDTQPYEDFFWKKNRLERRRARVQSIDFQEKKLLTADGAPIEYDRLVLATGSKSNKFGWAGQDLDGVHGLYHLQDLQAMERHSAAGLRRAVIVGGGLIGIEMAEMFHSRGIAVTFLVREGSFWNNVLPAEESEMINRHIREHGIDLRLGTELKAILSDENGKCRTVVTSTGEEITCQFVGLTAGVSPNIDFLKNSSLETRRGILVDEFLKTNLPDVFAIGDCAELRHPPAGRRPIEAVWYVGRTMGKAVARTICGDATRYEPGVWFNSAKFFDIEHQIYGEVPPLPTAEHASVFWQHSDGKKSIRLVFERATGRVLGFNLMGVRYRHEVCERWILQGAHIEKVLSELGLANFDPEFFEEFESEVVAVYNRAFSGSLVLRRGRGLGRVLSFLGR